MRVAIDFRVCKVAPADGISPVSWRVVIDFRVCNGLQAYENNPDPWRVVIDFRICKVIDCIVVADQSINYKNAIRGCVSKEPKAFTGV